MRTQQFEKHLDHVETDTLTYLKVAAGEAETCWDFLQGWEHSQVPYLQSHPTLLILVLVGTTAAIAL